MFVYFSDLPAFVVDRLVRVYHFKGRTRGLLSLLRPFQSFLSRLSHTDLVSEVCKVFFREELQVKLL